MIGRFFDWLGVLAVAMFLALCATLQPAGATPQEKANGFAEVGKALSKLFEDLNSNWWSATTLEYKPRPWNGVWPNPRARRPGDKSKNARQRQRPRLGQTGS
jgi:hypothetical protein